jgi:hypothetical protein
MVVLFKTWVSVDVGYFVFYPEYLMLLDPIMGFISDNTDLFGEDGGIFIGVLIMEYPSL